MSATETGTEPTTAPEAASEPAAAPAALPTRDEAIAFLAAPGPVPQDVFDRAFALRRAHKGLKVGVQLLTNARSGNCSQDCAYCAQSCRSSAAIDRYRWVGDAKIAADGAFVAKNRMARQCIGLSGMSFTDADVDRLAARIRELKAQGVPSICCSIGFLTRDQAVRLREAGLDRINHNLNTSRRFYPQICTTHTWDERVANIRMLQGLGYEICCGGIVGMGEEPADVVDMLLEVHELAPESVPINFLLPIGGTPLGDHRPDALTTDYCLKVLCLARIMAPATSDLRCAAGREVYFKGRERELLSIVDSIFADGYLTEKGQGLDDTIGLIERAGFEYEAEGEVG